MEFSLDDNRAGSGSSILLSPEVIAIRAKLIEACDGKTFSETIDFLKQLLDKEQDEQKRLGILAARVYVLRQRITEIQEKEDASLVSKFMAPEQDLPDNLSEDNLFEDDEENDTDWVRLRITENSIVKGVRFPKGVIVDVHHEEAEILIEAGKAETVEVSEPEIDEELEDGSDTSSEQMEDEELEDVSDASSKQTEDEE
ncbi:MAG: hypothetical protein VW299_01750 [Alphaproteobacteria bacterium]